MRFDKIHNRVSDQGEKKRKIRIKPGYSEHNPPSPSYTSPQSTIPSHDPINPLRNKVARNAKREQASGNAPEPSQVALVLLTRHPDVHAPHTGDDVHGQDDGAEDGEFAEDVGGLLGALVHADVDLGEVVAVGAGEEAVSG